MFVVCLRSGGRNLRPTLKSQVWSWRQKTRRWEKKPQRAAAIWWFLDEVHILNRTLTSKVFYIVFLIRTPKTKKHISWRSMLHGMSSPPTPMSWRSKFPSKRATSLMVERPRSTGSHILSACRTTSWTHSRIISPTTLKKTKWTSSSSTTKKLSFHHQQETEL